MLRAPAVIVAMVRLLSVALPVALMRSSLVGTYCLGHVDTTPLRDRAGVLLDVDVELGPPCTGTERLADSQTISIWSEPETARGERLDRRRETSFRRTSEVAAPYHVTVRSLGRFGGESRPRDMTRVEPARQRAGVVWS